MSDGADDHDLVIHYSVAFTWPIEAEKKDSKYAKQSKKPRAGRPTYDFSPVGREWNDTGVVQGRNGPIYYFQSLIALLNKHKHHPIALVRFSVHVHGKVWKLHGGTLEPLLHRAAAPARLEIVSCPIHYPYQYPLSSRIVPAIDSSATNEIVVVLDVHDDLNRQAYEIAYFLQLVTGDSDVRHDGILTFWPIEPANDYAIRKKKIFGTGMDGFNDMQSFKEYNAAPVARAVASKNAEWRKYFPLVKNGAVKLWYVDAGLIITNSTARDNLRRVYGEITFEAHLHRMVQKTDYACSFEVTHNIATTDELVLNQYLLAFQPQREEHGLDSEFLGQRFHPSENAQIRSMWKTVIGTFGPYVHTLDTRNNDPVPESDGIIAPDQLETVKYDEWYEFTAKTKFVNSFVFNKQQTQTSLVAQSLPVEVALQAALEWQATPSVGRGDRRPLLEQYTHALVL